MKKAFAGVLFLGVAIVLVAYAFVGVALKKGLETYGPQMLGAPVSVSMVSVSPISGKGSIRGLKIGNPKGFTTPHAIEVGRVAVKLDVVSLLSGGRILVNDVTVDEPSITLETGAGGTNLQVLQRNLEAYSPPEPKGSGKAEGPGRNVEIRRFRLRGAKAAAVVPQLQGEPAVVSLPDVEITGIGSKSGGATAADAARQILGAVTQAALRSAGGMDNLLQHGVRALGGSDAAKKLESLKSLFKK